MLAKTTKTNSIQNLNHDDQTSLKLSILTCPSNKITKLAINTRSYTQVQHQSSKIQVVNQTNTKRKAYPQVLRNPNQQHKSHTQTPSKLITPQFTQRPPPPSPLFPHIKTHTHTLTNSQSCKLTSFRYNSPKYKSISNHFPPNFHIHLPSNQKNALHQPHHPRPPSNDHPPRTLQHQHRQLKAHPARLPHDLSQYLLPRLQWLVYKVQGRL